MADTAPAVSSGPPIAIFKKRNVKKGANIRKRPATSPPDSDSASDDYASDDNPDRSAKRHRRAGITVSAAPKKRDNDVNLTADSHTADTTANIQITNDATKQSYVDLLGRPRTDRREHGTSTGSNAPKQLGPVKAATNIRTVTFTDFAPDVCKDYKQTGFCGFGDSCKFLHAREDYKQGWELDKDWEINTKGKKIEGRVVSSANRSSNAEDVTEDDRLKDIPFACFICKGPYKFPVITKCGHYFCEKCALGRYKTTPSCAACGSGTGGVFNGARDLQKLLERKREKMEEDGEEETVEE